MENESKKDHEKKEDRRLKPCTMAPEWAEHARSEMEGEPCDDGRMGNVCGSRDGEPPCDDDS